MQLGIDTPTKRKKLTTKKEPYWRKLGTGTYLGYRKSKTNVGSWIARRQYDSKTKVYESLGRDDHMDFEQAVTAATIWFKSNTTINNTSSKKITVNEVINNYITSLKVRNSKDSAYRTDKQLRKHFTPTLGHQQFKKLTAHQLSNWHESLIDPDADDETKRKSKNSANRVLSMVKAAFNLALKNGIINTNDSWKNISPFNDVNGKRELLLSEKQILKLIKKAPSSTRQLITAQTLTGARPGELDLVLVKNFNSKKGTLYIPKSKTGARVVYLQKQAIQFFNKIIKNKEPDAFLLTDDGRQWTKKKKCDCFRSAATEAKLPEGAVLYTLRHYHISKALLAGLPAQLIAENCGTSVKKIEEHYGKFDSEERLKMFDKVSLI